MRRRGACRTRRLIDPLLKRAAGGAGRRGPLRQQTVLSNGVPVHVRFAGGRASFARLWCGMPLRYRWLRRVGDVLTRLISGARLGLFVQGLSTAADAIVVV
jgi:hypothetical protein